MTISLDNIEEYQVPFEEYIYNWTFMDENNQPPSKEHLDQICLLTKEAALFLWDYQSNIILICSDKHFKNISTFNSGDSDHHSIKKYLYNLGIPFSQKVFISDHPYTGFVLTWKMVIKYAHKIFWANDQSVWDRTQNWKLEFHRDGEFTFGKDYIYDGQVNMLKNKEKLEIALKEMEGKEKSLSTIKK